MKTIQGCFVRDSLFLEKLMEKVIVIGIAGGTGSGKSTMVDKIKEEFKDQITMLSHDYYYKRHEISFEERKKLNYDHPNAFDTDLMIEHVKALKEWKEIEKLIPEIFPEFLAIYSLKLPSEGRCTKNRCV